jgi:PAS domain S-box-containing protein
MRFLLQLLSPPSVRSLRSRVLLVLASVALAVAVRHALDPWLGNQAAYLMVLPAVILSAWVGGFWAGMAATVLGVLLSIWMFVEPRQSLSTGSMKELILAGWMLVQGLVVSGLCDMIHVVLARWQAARRQAARDFENMADHAPGFVWASTMDGSGGFVNRSWLTFTGLDPGRSATDRLERLHPADVARVVKVMEEAKGARRSYYVEYRLRRADGAYRWILEHAVPRFGPEGNFEGFIGSGTDITPAYQEREELRFIGELQTALAATLDLDKTTAVIAKAVAPALADWCAIHILNEESGALEPVCIHHADESKRRRLAESAARPAEEGFARTEGYWRIVREGEPHLTSGVDEAFLRGLARNAEQLELLRALKLVSYLGVPLRVRGRIIGVLSLATGESGRPLGRDMLALVMKVGGIAAFALDNAALHRSMREALDAEGRARREMENSDRRFRFAWEADIFGMCVISTTGELREANAMFLRLHGYTPEDMAAGRVELFSRMGERQVRFGTFILEHLKSAPRCEPFEKICTGAGGRQASVLVVGGILPEEEGCLVFMLDLSARKQAEAELERQRALLKTIIDAVPAMVAYIGQDERFLVHNRQYERWLGIGHADIHGKTVRELLGEARYPDAEPHLRAALAGNDVRYEKVIHGADSSRDAMVTYHPDKDAEGRTRGVVIHAYDITETRRMAVAVQRSERRYRTLITATASIVWRADADGRVREANGWERFTGLALGEDVHERWTEAIHAEDRERVVAEWDAASRSGETFDSVYRLRSASGGFHHVRSRGAAIFAPDGALEEWIGTVSDIHQRVEAEQSLRSKEAELKLIIDAMPALVARVDRDRRYVMANEGYRKWYGIDPEALRGKAVRELVGEDVYRRVEPLLDRVLKGEEVSFEAHMDYSFGPPRWVSSKLSPHFGDNGEVVGYFALVLDISERKESERKVSELFERYRFLADAMPQNVWTADAAGRQDYVNRRWIEYTGLEPDMEPAQWRGIVHPDDLHETMRRWAHSVATGEDYLMEHRLRDARGEYHWFLSLAKARRDDSGAVAQWVGSATNIDRQRKAYAELAAARAQLRRHADELENEVRQRTARLEEVNDELEAFSYSVSHDLRVPLHHIHAFVEAVAEQEQGRISTGGLENLRLVLSSAKRMDALIRDLLAYSRLARAEIRLDAIPLDKAVAEVLLHHRATIQAAGAEVRVEGPLPAVQADRVGLEQVLTNLIGNALKFVAPDRRPEVVVRAEGGGERVRLWIEDNGIGIEPRQREAIFEIFRRLHNARDYAGTGVGLSLVRKGMARMGGSCGVESEPGKGSRFWLEFAAAREPEKTAGG